jgi:hypothetical protein
MLVEAPLASWGAALLGCAAEASSNASARVTRPHALALLCELALSPGLLSPYEVRHMCRVCMCMRRL